MMSTESKYRLDLPPIPYRIKLLPVDRGYPVPWFVPWIDGKPEFRMADSGKLGQAIRLNLCWVCGQPLGRWLAFVVGPMCTINRVSAEPPMHQECAEFSALACPFLTQKEPERREEGLPAGREVGLMIKRQPGCVCLWITRTMELRQVPGGILFGIGAPLSLKWFSHGRAATRQEVMASIESGYPILLGEAEKDGPEAVALLGRMRDQAMAFIPD